MSKRTGTFFLLTAFSCACWSAQSFAQTQSAPKGDAAASPEQQAVAALAITHGKLRAPGLKQNVEVIRDTWGVPHIYANNQHDLFFAQGFVTAQDRLFQMELWKRAGQGRLAEVVGESGVARDIVARLLRYRGSMDAEYTSYAPDAREILTAFTDGINAYIRSLQEPGGPGLPVEFEIAGFAPEAWKPEDCLSRMPTLAVTGNADAELIYAKLLAEAGAKKTALLTDFQPPVNLDPAPGLDLEALAHAKLAGFQGTDTRIEFPSPLEGSNNWTVSGKLTKTGKPLLANDPHRTMAIPSLRYVVHLVAPGWDVIGATEPALPGVSIGHNKDIAWGLTVFPVDQEDLYLEDLNPADPLQYKTQDGWARMNVEETTIAIRGAATRNVQLKFTRHGPVLWEDGKHALALRWIGTEPGTVPYLAALSVDRAKNWKEYLSAMQRWKSPPENLVYADREGNIGEQSAGLTPVREGWTGLLPVPGASGFEWSGFIPLDQLPRQFNPTAGFYATANNKTTPDNYPYAVGFNWSETRVERINEVLSQARNARKKLTVADMEDLQNDVMSLPARELIPLLRTALAKRPEFDDSSAKAGKLLLDWDFRLSADSAAAALYEVWNHNLSSRIVRQITGVDVDETGISPEALLRILKEPAVDNFKAISVTAGSARNMQTLTIDPETARDNLILGSLSEAWKELAKLQGPDATQWKWGRLHGVSWHHPLDRNTQWAGILNPSGVARPGDGNTVDATGGKDYAQTHGASYREIFDLADWDHSVAIDVPGESGQPKSPHYANLLPLWAKGEYFPLLFTGWEVEKHAPERLELRP